MSLSAGDADKIFRKALWQQHQRRTIADAVAVAMRNGWTWIECVDPAFRCVIEDVPLVNPAQVIDVVFEDVVRDSESLKNIVRVVEVKIRARCAKCMHVVEVPHNPPWCPRCKQTWEEAPITRVRKQKAPIRAWRWWKLEDLSQPQNRGIPTHPDLGPKQDPAGWRAYARAVLRYCDAVEGKVRPPDPILRSWSYEVLWEGPVMEADEVPDEPVFSPFAGGWGTNGLLYNRHGIWCWHIELSPFMRVTGRGGPHLDSFQDHNRRVAGLLDLRGRVVVHERGYRAERVRIVALAAGPGVPKDWYEALEARYHCNVYPLEEAEHLWTSESP